MERMTIREAIDKGYRIFIATTDLGTSKLEYFGGDDGDQVTVKNHNTGHKIQVLKERMVRPVE